MCNTCSLWGFTQHGNIEHFNITIRAQSCWNSIVLHYFFSAPGECHSNKRHEHSLQNKVSIESTEVDIFRVIYGSLWIISICSWITFSAHLCMHLFLCIPHHYFHFAPLNLAANTASTQTDLVNRMIHVIQIQAWWKMLASKSVEKSLHFLLPRHFLLIMDNAT